MLRPSMLLGIIVIALVSAEGDLPIPIGTMATGHLTQALVVPRGTTATIYILVDGPLAGSAGEYAKLPLHVTGTATPNLSTGRLDIALTHTVVGNERLPAKAYAIDARDTAFGLIARIDHLVPGTTPLPGAPQQPPAPDALKSAIPHFIVPAGTAVQVVWIEALTIPASHVPTANAGPSPTPDSTPGRVGRSITVAPGPVVRPEE